MTALSPAALDEAPPRIINPAIYSANLAALMEADGELASRLDALALPAHWRAVTGLDRSAAWRVELPGEPAAWLAGTAAPAARSEGLMAAIPSFERNPILSGLAVGAEAGLLLQRRKPHQAVFVVENELTVVRAWLVTRDVSQLLRERALILLEADHLAQRLIDLLTRFPGLGPPATIVVNPGGGISIDDLRRVCEQVTARISAERELRWAALREHSASRRAKAARIHPSGSAAPRPAVLALAPDPRDHRLAEALTAAATEVGWSAACLAADRSTHGQWLTAAELLDRHAPDLTVFVSAAAASLLPLAGRAAIWFQRPPAAAEAISAEMLCLAANDEIAGALERLNIDAARIVPFAWGCPHALQTGIDAAPRSDEVAILGDLPAAAPESCGIEQPTHKLIWTQARAILAAEWGTSLSEHPGELLAAAERRCKLAVQDDAVRELLMSGFRHSLMPAVVLESVAAAAWSAGLRVLAVGRGWARLAAGSARMRVMDDLLAPTAGSVTPLAAICAGASDAWQRDVPIAAGQGWRLLLHSPGKGGRATAMRRRLGAAGDFRPFGDERELLRCLRDIGPESRSAIDERADRVRGAHGYGVRWKELAAWMAEPRKQGRS